MTPRIPHVEICLVADELSNERICLELQAKTHTPHCLVTEQQIKWSTHLLSLKKVVLPSCPPQNARKQMSIASLYHHLRYHLNPSEGQPIQVKPQGPCEGQDIRAMKKDQFYSSL